MQTTLKIRANRCKVNELAAAFMTLIQEDGVSCIWTPEDIKQMNNKKSTLVDALVETRMTHMKAKEKEENKAIDEEVISSLLGNDGDAEGGLGEVPPEISETLSQKPGTMQQLLCKSTRSKAYLRDAMVYRIADEINAHFAHLEIDDAFAEELLHYKFQKSSVPIRRVLADFNHENIAKLRLEFRGTYEVIPTSALMPRRAMRVGTFDLQQESFSVVLTPRSALTAWSGDL